MYQTSAIVPVAHRRWLLRNAIVGAAVVNLAVAGIPAAIVTLDYAVVPLWATPLIGGPSIITQTLGTLVMLPTVTTVLSAAHVRRDIRAGRLAPLAGFAVRPHRATSVAALGLAVFACAAIASGGLAPLHFVLYSAIFAAALSIILTPLIALRAMARQ
ncbi:hypothetical protein [Nocardia sp. NPDC052566]|uniref:hypothetical protein n=1 Tax=Nocardia sp. NPDC052566 TaxID=3364330 RepID=UPI0037C6307B